MQSVSIIRLAVPPMHKLQKNRASPGQNDWSTGGNKTRLLILTNMASQQPASLYAVPRATLGLRKTENNPTGLD